jgi:hypothetical protein
MTEYLLIKRGLYYAPNRQGYTGVKARAGRYTQDEGEALADCGVTFVHQDEAPMFSPACWNDVKVGYLLERIAEREKALRDLLPGKLCGESWGCPDDETVGIAVRFPASAGGAGAPMGAAA